LRDPRGRRPIVTARRRASPVPGAIRRPAFCARNRPMLRYSWGSSELGRVSVQGKLIVALAAVLTVVAWSAHAQQGNVTAADKTPSEAEELQTALRANSADALRAYLQKYPETSRRSEPLTTIAQMRRGEFTEWTIYEIDNQRFLQFVKLSSIRQLGDRVAAETKSPVDPAAPGWKFPERSYRERLIVVDCKRPRLAAAESKVVDPSGQVL